MKLAVAPFAALLLGCASDPGLQRTSITCPAGRTLLDGVCVGEAVADEVVRERAMGQPDLTGAWTTTVFWDHGEKHVEATVAFTQTGSELVGVFFVPNEGRIHGHLSGSLMRGSWVRPPHGGRIQLAFDPAGTTFQGTYADKDDVPEVWDGHRP